MKSRGVPDCLRSTEQGYNVDPRLHELVPTAKGSQEAGFTQPRVHLIAHLCISPVCCRLTKQFPNRQMVVRSD